MKFSDNNLYIWGIKFNLLSLKDFMLVIDKKIKTGETPIHITGINTATVIHSKKEPLVRNAILESDLVNIDNIFNMLALRSLGYKVPERVPTPDLFEALLFYAHKSDYSVFILGATKESLNKALDTIRIEYSNLKIDGNDGFYERDKESVIIEKINKFAPDFLFLALPSPEKELFILKYKNELSSKLLLGIGGAVDAKANIVRRAPLFFRKLGLEGFFRFLQKPKYFGKRYLSYYPAFMKIYFKSIFTHRKDSINGIK